MANYNDLDKLIYLISKNHIENYHLYHTNILEINSCDGRYVSWLNELLYTNNYYCTSKSEVVVKHNNKQDTTNNIKFLKIDINKETSPIENCGIIIANFKINKPHYNISKKTLKHIHHSLHRNGLCIIICKTNPEDKYYNELYSRITDSKENERPLLKSIKQFKDIGYTKIDIFYKNLTTTGYILMK